MSEKDIRRNAAISDKLKNYPEIITKYYQNLLESGKSLGTARTYMASIFQFLDYSYGDHIPDDFFYSTSENDITFFLDSLKAKGDPNVSASGSAKAAVWSALMSLFSFISTKYSQVNNPVENIPRPAMTKKSASDLVYLTPEEASTLLDAVERDSSLDFMYRDMSIVMLGLFSGLRINEILDLNVDDVDIQNGTVRINDLQKGVRFINVSESVQRTLRGWLSDRKYNFAYIDTDALFVSQVKRRLSADMVQKFLNKYAKELDKHITPRVLRNTFAVNLYKKTKDIMLLAKYLDHASIATTQRYVDQLMLKEEKTFNMDCLYD